MSLMFYPCVTSSSPFASLSAGHGNRWTAIVEARAEAGRRRDELLKLVEREGSEFRPDMNLVVFGSLARAEWTSGSDIDWSLLVDGQTDPEDLHTAKRIEGLLVEAKWKKPGPSGIFGSLAFSHSLVHDIGGASDTHVNTTRRVLLLLESCAIGDGSVRDRVIRAVLARYLEEDTHFHPANGSRSFVPRFLLNDVVRYWRTIAVDYASKTREHDRTQWALRNIKLRFSRKLIFVAGLLMCFLCEIEQKQMPAEKDIFGGGDESSVRFINFLAAVIDQTPLDLLAGVMLQRKVSKETSEMIFNSYNQFLAVLNEPEKRNRLDSLTYEAARKDRLFNELRIISKAFQEGLRRLFFEEDKKLTRLAQIYAVF
jgi:predicted nucleotidyltransferase